LSWIAPSKALRACARNWGTSPLVHRKPPASVSASGSAAIAPDRSARRRPVPCDVPWDRAAQRAAAGKHVALVDMYTGFNPSTMLVSDNIHPNSAGYKFMTDRWHAAVGSLLPK
jgi:hypothetical protein